MVLDVIYAIVCGLSLLFVFIVTGKTLELPSWIFSIGALGIGMLVGRIFRR